MLFKYCPKCGSELKLKDSWDEGKVPVCPVDNTWYFNLPKPCVVVAVIKNDYILLLKQSYIYKNSKVLISGYVGINETAEESAIREVKEEAGIDIEKLKYLGSDYVPDKELLMLTYVAKYKSGNIVKSDEVEEIKWVELKNALSEMKEDRVGRKVVNKVLNLIKEKSF